VVLKFLNGKFFNILVFLVILVFSSCVPNIQNSIKVVVNLKISSENVTPFSDRIFPNALVDEISKLELVVKKDSQTLFTKTIQVASTSITVDLNGFGEYIFELYGYNSSNEVILYGLAKKLIQNVQDTVNVTATFKDAMVKYTLNLSQEVLDNYTFKNAKATLESKTGNTLSYDLTLNTSKILFQANLKPGVWYVSLTMTFISKLTAQEKTEKFEDIIEISPLKNYTYEYLVKFSPDAYKVLINTAFPYGYVYGFDEIKCKVSKNGTTVFSKTFNTQNLEILIPEKNVYQVELEAWKNGSVVFKSTNTLDMTSTSSFNVLFTEGYFEKLVAFDKSNNLFVFEKVGQFSSWSTIKVNGQDTSYYESHIYPGLKNIIVKFDQSSLIREINFQKDYPQNIRVRISAELGNVGNLISSYFNQVTFELNGAYIISVQTPNSFANLLDKQFNAENLKIALSNNNIIISLGSNNLGSFPINSRIYVKSEVSGTRAKILERIQANGKNNYYEGDFEVIYTQGSTSGFRVINELNIDNYLYYVLPSEMNASYVDGALQSQAIVARTYAMYKILNDKRLASIGANVDDSINYQVYNREGTADLFKNAVNTTSGKIVMYNSQVAATYFYANSGGIALNSIDVFNMNVPYLVHKHLTLKNEYLPNPLNETEISTFIRNWDKAYLRDKGYFEFTNSMTRWKVEFTPEKILQNVALAQYVTITNPFSSSSLVSNELLEEREVKKMIQENRVILNTTEKLLDVKVTKRGLGGDVKEFQIITTSGTKTFPKSKLSTVFKLDSQTPVYISNGTSRTDFGYLLSDFVTFEVQKDSSGNVTKVIVWGGGFGHGIGMSQVGVHCLCKYYGYTGEQAALYFFKDCNIQKVY